MATVLAILWEKPTNSLSYMVYDSADGSVPLLPQRVQINQTHVSAQINAVFSQAAIHVPSVLEYKILQHGTPAPNIRGRMPQPRPHALSLAVYNAVATASANLIVNPQQRSKLKGPALCKFRSGIRDLRLAARGRGTAWQVHLWAVALHATNSNYKKVLKKYWSILRQVSTQTKAGKQQFQTWYANL